MEKAIVSTPNVYSLAYMDKKSFMEYHEYLLKYDLFQSTTSRENIAQGFIDLELSKPIEEEPVLIGYLNRVFGYNGFSKAKVGTEVYSFKDKYYFEIQSLTDTISFKVKFYKETLKPCINFI